MQENIQHNDVMLSELYAPSNPTGLKYGGGDRLSRSIYSKIMFIFRKW